MADDKVPSAEVATTSTEIAPAGAGAKVKKGRARSVVLLLVVAGLLSFLAVPVVYLRGEVLNTNRYVASVAPLNYNPVVADAIATRLTNELFKDLDVQHIVNTTLPGPLKGFTGSLTDQLHSYVQQLAVRVIKTPQFHVIWVNANRIAHQQLVRVLTGSNAEISVDNSGNVSLNLQAALEHLKSELVAKGATFFANVPVGFVPSRVVLLKSSSLGQIRTAVRLLNDLAIVLVILAVGCFVAAVALSQRRRRTLFQAGLTLCISMAVLAVAVAIGRTVAVNQATGQNASGSAVREIYDTVLARLHFDLRLLFVIGAIVVIGAWLSGSSRPGVATREALRKAGQSIATFARPATNWLVARRRPVQFVIAGLAMIFLVFFAGPLSGVLVGVIAAALIVWLELAGRRAQAPPALEEGSTVPTLHEGESVPS